MRSWTHKILSAALAKDAMPQQDDYLLGKRRISIGVRRKRQAPHYTDLHSTRNELDSLSQKGMRNAHHGHGHLTSYFTLNVSASTHEADAILSETLGAAKCLASPSTTMSIVSPEPCLLSLTQFAMLFPFSPSSSC